VQPSFDLEAERFGQYSDLGSTRRVRHAVQLQLRPGLALAILFLRGFLVWARALEWEASRGSRTPSRRPASGSSSSWYQSPLISMLYRRSRCARPRIELGGKRIDEPAFTRP
jgi:hypothetical protein